ncbi:hypothetical protein CMI37_34440 [Candidatus Pacearchaeota archaeon]|nr:hypothetical protein [Candidatus Pacearchaeota archaeon]
MSDLKPLERWIQTSHRIGYPLKKVKKKPPLTRGMKLDQRQTESDRAPRSSLNASVKRGAYPKIIQK